MDNSHDSNEPVAVVTGTYGGRFTVEPLKPAAVLPVNMALYTRPQAREPEQQEPIGEVSGYYDQGFTEHKTLYGKLHNQDLPVGTKLYTRPQAREPLTDEQIDALWLQNSLIQAPDRKRQAFARAIEAAHGIE